MCADAPAQGGAHEALPPDCRTETLGVAFFDLSRIAEWSSSDEDTRVAVFFQRFYELAAEHIEGAGGRIVKLMGDAGLAVFPTERAEDVVFALAELGPRARDCARGFGLDTYLNTSVHVGPVLAGSFGPAGSERFDVIGKTVNVAARLGRRGLTLSPQAFRCLSAEGRGRFQKIKRPVTYRMRG
ncbi:MAG: adenylate/guanylate cyclase domain-containing protein [Candidatus Brocadiae bacterium]|nr:adenylate/guanylate cyclase domain-containing protein [Candidatus Brocadiia bacterium]